MRPPNALARVLVVVDLSCQTEAALRCADELRGCRPAAVDVYYLWPGHCGPEVDFADRTIAAAAGLARSDGALDRLDRLTALERTGTVALAGWLTRVRCGGSSLAGIAVREGYDVVVVGLERLPHSTHRFDLYRHERSNEPATVSVVLRLRDLFRQRPPDDELAGAPRSEPHGARDAASGPEMDDERFERLVGHGPYARRSSRSGSTTTEP